MELFLRTGTIKTNEIECFKSMHWTFSKPEMNCNTMSSHEWIPEADEMLNSKRVASRL